MHTDSTPAADSLRDLPLAARLGLLALFLYLILPVWVLIASSVLEGTGFIAWYYGPPPEGAGLELWRTRVSLWPTVLAFPFWLGSVVLFFRLAKLVPPAEIGLRWPGAATGLSIGLTAAIVVTPVVLGLNYGAVWLFKDVLGFPVTEHPFTAAGQHGLSAVEWGLLAFAVSVSAPVWEELVFRGALQRLVGTRSWGGHLALVAALVVAALREPHRAEPSTWPLDVLSAHAPVLFVLAMVPAYLALWLGGRTRHSAGVFGVALLFGAIHSFAWPTPIALFVLGLALGYLTLWTRSLVAAILLHSLFNGVSFVLLLTGWGGK